MNWLIVLVGVVIVICIVMVLKAAKSFIKDFHRARKRHLDSC